MNHLQHYIEREMTLEAQEAARQFPVVTITGPRQAGKTTLVQQCFPDKPYVNLESIQDRTLATEDATAFIKRYPQGAIIDEIQHAPDLLSEIQVMVDRCKMPGMFILTSHLNHLTASVAQSLAGRTALLHLLPLSLAELSCATIHPSIDELLLKGGYPDIYQKNIQPHKLYSHYVQSYLERDLRQLIAVKKLSLFQKFLKICAGRVGQTINQALLANEVGVSAKTIEAWLSLLEASYVICRLPPYHENFGKRAIKSPKLYFTDVGLAAFLLGIETPTQMQRDPLRGHLFENLVVMELIKTRWNQGLCHHLHFFRDSNQNEVDVVFQRGHELIPIEIKSAQQFHPSFFKGLRYFSSLVTNRAIQPCLIYAGTSETNIQGIRLLNIWQTAKAICTTNNP